MSSSAPPDPELERRVGLCARCHHARPHSTKRGSTFWRCLRADTDPRFVRYPALPVRECPGYEVKPQA